MSLEEVLSLPLEEYIKTVEKQIKMSKKLVPEQSFTKAVQSRRIKKSSRKIGLPKLGNYIK